MGKTFRKKKNNRWDDDYDDDYHQEGRKKQTKRRPKTSKVEFEKNVTEKPVDLWQKYIN